jgi:hypothetical protein
MKYENKFHQNFYRNIIFMQFHADFGLAGTQIWATCNDIFKEESNIRKIITLFPIHAFIIQVFRYLSIISFVYMALWFIVSMNKIFGISTKYCSSIEKQD